jgi:cation diffusion facilitator family transporter
VSAHHDTHAHHHRDDHEGPSQKTHDHRGGLLKNGLWHLVAPHSHDHADVIDTATADREGARALVISLGVLGATGLAQLIILAISGSVALMADTIHNFSDALTAVPLGVAFWLARRPANRRYTYGYGRAEDLAGIFIVTVIAISAGVAAWEAVQRLVHPQAMTNAAWVAAAGIVGCAGNELVATYRIRVGRRIGSAALVADGLHARTDGLTSLAVLVAALGAIAGWDLADPIIGLLISAAIINVLRLAARDICRRLMDRVDPALVERIERQLHHVDGITDVGRIRVRWVGHELHADADVTIPGRLAVYDADAIVDTAQVRLTSRIPRLTDVVIRAQAAPLPGS